ALTGPPTLEDREGTSHRLETTRRCPVGEVMQAVRGHVAPDPETRGKPGAPPEPVRAVIARSWTPSTCARGAVHAEELGCRDECQRPTELLDRQEPEGVPR